MSASEPDEVRFEFGLLGPLTATAGGQEIAVGGPRQRTILARLLLAWGQVVSVDSLVEEVWDGRQPSTARTQVAICVAALRKAFKAAGREDGLIETVHPGYRLQTDGCRLDVRDFAGLAERAAAARQGTPAEAAEQYGQALALWRGPALAGVNGRELEEEAARLEEQRLSVYEAWTGMELVLGRHQEMIPRLVAVVRENPLREQLRQNLMLAQYRSGRRAEATETFREGRRRLIDELGLEPGPETQRLHAAILRDAPELTAPAPPAATAPAAAEGQDEPEVRVVAAQLPPNIPAFVGRGEELATLDGLLADRSREEPPALGFVTGVAGVGKTGLVVHWAHRAADAFPDGQLYADLRGHDEHQEPVTAGAVLRRFLRSLGVPGEQIPADQGERAAMYRSILADRRVLVVLDDARTFGQIRDLLPGNGRCCVLVTSREQQDHLAVGHGGVRVNLGVLPELESLELLGRIAGPERIARDEAGARKLGWLCDHLPLALRIAAARLASKPHWTVRHLVTRLADERRRLDELSAGELEVRASFGLSYRYLPADAAQLYRRLGLLDVPDFSAWVGAAVLDIPLLDAEDLMEQLVEAQLLEAVSISATGVLRYRFQNLLRLYARERAGTEESGTDQRDSLDRAFRGWLTLTEQAHRREYGGDFSIIHGTAERLHLDEDLVDELLTVPLDWLEAERPALVAAIGQACKQDMDEIAWDLTTSSLILFETRSYHEDWQLCSERALEATRRAGNRRGEAAMCAELAALKMYQRRFDQAAPLFTTAIELFEEVGEPHGRALALRNMAIIDRLRGDLGLAMERLEEARPALRAAGDTSVEAHALNQMAQIELELGRQDSAVRLSLEAVRLAETIGETRGKAQTLNRLAGAYLSQERFELAEETYREVLRIVREKRDSRGEVHALLGLGETQLGSGLADRAEVTLLESLALVQRLDDPMVEGRVNLALGRSLQRLARPGQARRSLETAREIFRQVGSPLWEQQVDAELAVTGSTSDDPSDPDPVDPEMEENPHPEWELTHIVRTAPTA
ncbi:BTAD domain-containing putative transcriptional regulator [Kitasatospora kazusensis]|uniref:BTAD domain-containing putative transcriptional regulator n=1 Tax=Kitasatospora kazusensis TaxID=407974 RepID=A0ABN2Z9V7_9ACTN